MFTRNKYGNFVVNTLYNIPVLVTGDGAWKKCGLRLRNATHSDWKDAAHCSVDELIVLLLNLETKVNEQWRQMVRNKIKRHQMEIRGVGLNYEH